MEAKQNPHAPGGPTRPGRLAGGKALKGVSPQVRPRKKFVKLLIHTIEHLPTAADFAGTSRECWQRKSYGPPFPREMLRRSGMIAEDDVGFSQDVKSTACKWWWMGGSEMKSTSTPLNLAELNHPCSVILPFLVFALEVRLSPTICTKYMSGLGQYMRMCSLIEYLPTRQQGKIGACAPCLKMSPQFSCLQGDDSASIRPLTVGSLVLIGVIPGQSNPPVGPSICCAHCHVQLTS